MVMVNGKSLPKDDWHRKYYWDLRKNAWNCSRCSVCKWVDSWEVKSARFAKICPSSLYYLFDAYSCQGRMDVSLALIDGNLKYEDSPGLLDIYYKCNMCGGCDAMCKRVQDMEPLRVIQEMRAKLVGDGQLLPFHMPVIDNLRKEDNMMMKPKAERGKWAEGLKVKDLTKEKAEVVFHAGCILGFDEELGKVARTAVTLLQNAGVDVGIMGKDETCCGGRAFEMGYQGELTKYAESNVEAWTNAGVKTVVTVCSDGYYTFKHLYPELGYRFEVLHIVEFIDRLIKEGTLKFTKTIPMTVTYHDPCHLGRRDHVYVPGEAIMGIYDSPRDIIKSIPGIKLIEMERIKEYAWCCGAGGGVKEAYPDFNTFTAQERTEEARATGAEALVTACPWCERNFLDTLNGDKMKVYDIVELVQQAI
ncbi:MAG: (Fe-S)-binding protein [Dehalococcoidales bacterium]